MKTKKQKWLWIAPLLIVLSGIINLSNSSLHPILRNTWVVLIPMAFVILVVGIKSHMAVKEKGDNILSESFPCPKCNNSEIQKVNFTWWGGILGPRLFHIGKCKKCGNEFNYKTGRKNIVSIIIYVLVLNAIIIFAFFVLGRMVGVSLKNTNKNLTIQSI